MGTAKNAERNLSPVAASEVPGSIWPSNTSWKTLFSGHVCPAAHHASPLEDTIPHPIGEVELLFATACPGVPYVIQAYEHAQHLK